MFCFQILTYILAEEISSICLALLMVVLANDLSDWVVIDVIQLWNLSGLHAKNFLAVRDVDALGVWDFGVLNFVIKIVLFGNLLIIHNEMGQFWWLGRVLVLDLENGLNVLGIPVLDFPYNMCGKLSWVGAA